MKSDNRIPAHRKTAKNQLRGTLFECNKLSFSDPFPEWMNMVTRVVLEQNGAFYLVTNIRTK